MILEIIIFLSLLVVSYHLLRYFNHVLKLKHFPPGPFPLPVIGNLHLMGDKRYETFGDLAKQYGDVFSFSFGMQRMIIVNTVEPAREALITKGIKFAGRSTENYIVKLLSKGFKGIVFADYGPTWVFSRKLGHSALKMYGDGLGNLESLVIKESEEMHRRIQEREGQAVDISREFGLSVLNIICSMVFGNRYEINDKQFLEVDEMCSSFSANINSVIVIAFLPWTRFFLRNSFQIIKKRVSIQDRVIHEKFQQHKDTFDPENIRDFTYSLIKTMKEGKEWENVGIKEVTDDHLETIISSLFAAGSETTSTTLTWMVLYLLHWPQYQDKVFNEIKQVVGLERYPELKDRSNLPLTQAVIQETLRLSSIISLGVMHKAVENSTIGGNNIPKNSNIIFNLWNIHHDPKEWENPNEFNPYRWLNEEGKYIPGKHKSFLPFSAGRRSCLGESMAKTELFIFLSRLIRDFKIEAYKEEPFPSLQGLVGFTLLTQPFKAILIARESL